MTTIEHDEMSDLAPFVVAVIRDEAVSRLMDENLELRKRNEKFRSMIRHVNVQFVGPNDEQPLVDGGRDHEGLCIFWERIVDLQQSQETVELEDGGFYPMSLQDFLQSKVRFEDCFVTGLLGEISSSRFYLTSALVDLQGRVGFGFTWEFGDAEETISFIGSVGSAHLPYSMKHCSELAGVTTEELRDQLAFNADGLGGIRFPHGVQVDVAALEEIWPQGVGAGFHLEVSKVTLPFQYTMKKCHLI